MSDNTPNVNGGGRKPPIKAGTRFMCPKCKNTVTVHVGIFYYPSCVAHSKTTPITMEEIK